MSVPIHEPRWVQFRRLIFGTIFECLRDSKIDVDVVSAVVSFEEGSKFQVPRLDNYMRFKGSFEAKIISPIEAAKLEILKKELSKSWVSLVSAIEIPVGDKLTVERNDVEVRAQGEKLTIQFDLDAD